MLSNRVRWGLSRAFCLEHSCSKCSFRVNRALRRTACGRLRVVAPEWTARVIGRQLTRWPSRQAQRLAGGVREHVAGASTATLCSRPGPQTPEMKCCRPAIRPNQRRREGSAVIVIGVDAHKETHTAVAVEEGTGRLLGELTVEAREPGLVKLMRFAEQHTDGGRIWAVEDCRHARPCPAEMRARRHHPHGALAWRACRSTTRPGPSSGRSAERRRRAFVSASSCEQRSHARAMPEIRPPTRSRRSARSAIRRRPSRRTSGRRLPRP